MREVASSLLLSMIVLPIILTGASPIRAEVPIYVPANLPVTGTVCLPSYLAVGLKAKLYVDNKFVDEGKSDDVGCYRVTIKPLQPGSHKLFAEIYKGDTLVAEISAEVIAIEGMVKVEPRSITMRRGESKKVTLSLENRSPINMSHIELLIESPFSIFGEHMTRVRNFAIKGLIGNLLVNETKKIRLELAVPSNFRPGTYKLKLNMTYEVGGARYSAPLEIPITVLSERAPEETQETIQISHPVTSSETSRGRSTDWIFLIAIISIIVVVILWLKRRSDLIGGYRQGEGK